MRSAVGADIEFLIHPCVGGTDPMFASFLILAYFSPETMLPLTSLIATVAGFALLIKRSSIRFVLHCCRAALRRRPRGSGIGKPHLGASVRKSGQEIRS
jgi:hypothetical protein